MDPDVKSIYGVPSYIARLVGERLGASSVNLIKIIDWGLDSFGEDTLVGMVMNKLRFEYNTFLYYILLGL